MDSVRAAYLMAFAESHGKTTRRISLYGRLAAVSISEKGEDEAIECSLRGRCRTEAIHRDEPGMT